MVSQADYRDLSVCACVRVCVCACVYEDLSPNNNNNFICKVPYSRNISAQRHIKYIVTHTYLKYS